MSHRPANEIRSDIASSLKRIDAIMKREKIREEDLPLRHREIIASARTRCTPKSAPQTCP